MDGEQLGAGGWKPGREVPAGALEVLGPQGCVCTGGQLAAFPSPVSEGGPRGGPCGRVGAGGVLGGHCVDASSEVGTGSWAQAGVLACCSPVLGGEQMLGE